MIEVAVAADERYVPHAATMLRSLLASNSRRALRAHFLHPPDLPSESINRLHAMVKDAGSRIEFHEIAGTSVLGLPAMGRISPVMWYRLLLPSLLPDADRVLYLDCDTLVLDDLTPLWELDMSSCRVAAVTNVFPDDLLHRPAELGIPAERYFNSGMLLMDLDAWRAAECHVAIAALAREHPERLVFPDQDALNIVLADSRLQLHPRWNAQNSLFYFRRAEEVFGAAAVARARSDPAILHFEGPAQAKPWHYRSTHPYRQTYLDHRAATPWPKVRLEGRPLGRRLHRSLRRSPT